MRIVYDVATDDWFTFMMARSGGGQKRPRGFWKNRLTATAAVASVCLNVILLLHLFRPFGESTREVLFLSGLGLLIVGAVWHQYPDTVRQLRRQTTRRVLEERADSSMFGRHELNVSDEGLAGSAKDGTFQCPWSAIKRLERLQDRFFIYTSEHVAFIICKVRVVEGDFEAFQQAVEEAFGKYRQAEAARAPR
jgi:hypothetical protein